ncbi:hypothetical protein Y032_0086g1906 [Ancylostoma ceylanicum]|uniref:SHSP domain-containing protein n=1 Tax=Ancylostoma ceylanicum TaxID=53326 RepID=A0A016TQD6_9BILA|nr:hypothetical protein Y032_0086g1906 [Ancylostoma ceylanicum]
MRILQKIQLHLCGRPYKEPRRALIFDDDVFDVFEDIGRCPEPFHDPAEEEAMSDLFEEVRDDGIKLTLSLNVSAFKPEELSVNLNEGTLTIEGKQEIKEDDSYSMRSFTRQWNSPRTSTSTRFTPPSLKTAASSLRPRTSQSQWEKTRGACKMTSIFVISTSNNPFAQNLSEFHELPYPRLPYRNPTKMGLRYKMNTIFVFNTSRLVVSIVYTHSLGLPYRASLVCTGSEIGKLQVKESVSQ